MINKVLKRTSIRSYIDKELDQQTLNKLIEVVNSAPTSMNGHIFSAVFVTDKNKLKQIKELMDLKMPANINSRDFIYHASLLAIFCIDINRLEYALEKNNQPKFNKGLDLLATASGDAYIGATMLMDAAISLDLGTCFLGSIKGIDKELKELLNITGNVIPMIGLVVGYPNQTNEVKPKLSKVFLNKYDQNSIKTTVDQYDITYSQYLQNRTTNTANNTSWSKQYSTMISNEKAIELLETNYKNWK